MKKVISLLLALVLCLSLCACGDNSEAENVPTVPVEEDTLTELEQHLVDYIIKIALEEYSEPSAVRVLNIGDYRERSKNEVDTSDYGPDTVVVQLMGESTLTGNQNPCYRVCLTTTENKSKDAQESIEYDTTMLRVYIINGGAISSKNQTKDSIMRYKGVAGEYIELSSSHEIAEPTDSFDIKRVNTALKEYWDNLGI